MLLGFWYWAYVVLNAGSMPEWPRCCHYMCKSHSEPPTHYQANKIRLCRKMVGSSKNSIHVSFLLKLRFVKSLNRAGIALYQRTLLWAPEVCNFQGMGGRLALWPGHLASSSPAQFLWKGPPWSSSWVPAFSAYLPASEMHKTSNPGKHQSSSGPLAFPLGQPGQPGACESSKCDEELCKRECWVIMRRTSSQTIPQLKTNTLYSGSIFRPSWKTQPANLLLAELPILPAEGAGSQLKPPA